jgi:hypothetical protein
MLDGLLRNGCAGPDLPTNHKRKDEIEQIWVQNATEDGEMFRKRIELILAHTNSAADLAMKTDNF